jgi:Uma2 family endonuclease
MAIQQKVYTTDDLWELSHAPSGSIEKRYELVQGEIREMSPAGGLHGGLASDLNIEIGVFVKQHDLGFVTAAETGYILYTDPVKGDTVRAPDVGFVAKHRLPDGLPVKYIPLAPDLAVEVVSPTDTADEIEEKVRDYLRAGTRLIWVWYPKTRSVVEHTLSGVNRYGEDDTLSGGDVLPRLTISIKAIFGA